LKTCPKCAETVKEEALVCRHCRHRFTEWDALPKEEKAIYEKRLNRVVAPAALFLFILLAIWLVRAILTQPS